MGRQVEALDFNTEKLRVSGFGTLGMTDAGKDAFGVQKDYIHDPQFGDVTILTDSVFGLQPYPEFKRDYPGCLRKTGFARILILS